MEAMVLASSLIRRLDRDEPGDAPKPVSDLYVVPRSGIFSLAAALLGTGVIALVLDALAR